MSLKKLAQSLHRREILLPYLREFLLKERQLQDSGKISHKQIVVRDAEQTIKCFQDRKREYNHQTAIEGEYFHPSRLGACMRQLFFGALNVPSDGGHTGDSLLRETMIFETGTYIGVFIQNLCERAGCLEAREVAIQNSKLKILGHADGIIVIRGERILLELKTINARGFSMTNAPKPEHIRQVHAYMKGLKLRKAVIVYYNKDTHLLKEFVVEFDDEVYRYEVRERIDYFFARLRQKKLPPRESSSVSHFPCSYCGFAKLCWQTDALATWMKKNKVTHTKVSIPIPPLKKLTKYLAK